MSQTHIPVNPGRIFDALFAFQQAAALKAAIDLGIFTAIAEGAATAAAIAAKCNSSERGIRILCDTLVTYEFLAKSENAYANAPDSALFLNRHSPACIASMADFLFVPDLVSHTLYQLPATVRKGGTMMEGEGSVSPENPMWVTFAHAMAAQTRMPAQIIASKLPGAGPLKVLDIAAGHGMYGIAVALHNPEARIVALDWPAVLEVAKENAAQAGISGRYSTIAGDFFTAELGSDYDAILITNFLHHFDVEACEAIFRKVHAALRPGGVAVVLEFVPDEDRVSPASQARFALTMLITTARGDAYTRAEYQAMIANAGYASAAIERIPSEQSVIIATK